ncbi:hypothetical protein [Streptomyces albireticuli]|nr:hypothetical protein [Streptomyces albireticuli]MCD9144697.1 hypothetical protein [Streptomyces albireticuli]MCD9165445.1 hypothetical protein [Streptomyces albireticuli]MCD9193604.1 hypothetical protein [Streptomyces albireticuli]
MKAMVAVSAVVALGLTAGCSGGDGPADGSGGSGRAGGARGEGKDARDAVRVLSPAQLKHVELGAREVPGFQIEKAGESAAGGGRPGTDRAPCRPLVDVLGSQPRPEPAASVVNTFAKAGEGLDFEGLMGMIRVSTYGRDGAAATLRGLRSAAEACADGFGMRTGEGEPQEFASVRTLPAPELGDEAVAYRLENAAERAPSLITVVRSGSTLAMFFATSLSDPEGVEIPPELVRAQVAKVEGAERKAPTVPPPPSSGGPGEVGEAGDSVG